MNQVKSSRVHSKTLIRPTWLTSSRSRKTVIKHQLTSQDRWSSSLSLSTLEGALTKTVSRTSKWIIRPNWSRWTSRDSKTTWSTYSMRVLWRRVSTFALSTFTHLFGHINFTVYLDDIRCIRFESWWMEGKDRNRISVVYRLDGQPHEIIIKDTKYYVKEIYSGEKKCQGKVVSCWDLHVGCYVDIFGKPTILK